MCRCGCNPGGCLFVDSRWLLLLAALAATTTTTVAGNVSTTLPETTPRPPAVAPTPATSNRPTCNATLRAVACDEAPPWTVTTHGGTSIAVGIEPDLLALACKLLDFCLDLKIAPLADAMAQIECGEIDVLLCGRVMDDGQRDLVADFSDPHTMSGPQVDT